MPKPANPKCVNCGHTAYHHRLDDATNLGPCDPDAKFRCIYPLPDSLPQDCHCPDMVVPADAGWPFNDAPEPEAAAQ